MFTKKTFALLFSCICFLYNASLFAQNASVKASINPSDIIIGQQATLQLDVTTNRDKDIVFPQYKDTLVAGVEVLSALKVDTVFSGSEVTYSQKYILTSFDSAKYTIPYIPVIEGLDTLRSNEVSLNVTPIELSDNTKAYLKEVSESQTDSIDFAKMGITDIKPIQKPPFVWTDYLNYILLGLLLLIIVIAIIVAIVLYQRKKKNGYFFKPEVILPPHIVALTALDGIKQGKMWQQGREKEYYTDLTDVLRQYVEKRFGTGAFEKTSEEILSDLKYNLEAESSLTSLQQVLKLADLVKFAKYTPLPDENDLSLMNAYLFVNQTKKEESIIDDPNKSVKAKTPSTQSEEDDDEAIDWTISNKNNKTTENS